MQKTHVTHPFPPIWDKDCRILILGSFPSVKSREVNFFYGHKQNRFWRVTAAVFDEKTPETIEEKRAFLLSHHIALWDTVASCEIAGSSDASLTNATPTDLGKILENAPIDTVFCNGKTSHTLYEKLQFPRTGRHAVCLPSTSPANAAWSLDRLCEAWRIIKEDIEKGEKRHE